MADYPEKIIDLYPSDTRWGDGYIPCPIGGVVTPAFEADLERTVASVKETILFFEEKYPAFKWWETAFVEDQPAVSLLMQSVNDRLAFQCMADIYVLEERVTASADTKLDGASIDVYAARIACGALQSHPDGQAQLHEALSHMTQDDMARFTNLVSGTSRE